MGLIKALTGSVGGVLADQWREFFYCDSIPEDVLATMGLKQVSGRSSNTKSDQNIISNGSVIAVADGQCMIIVDNGKVVELCAEPGEFTYDTSTEPSIFYGSLGKNIIDSFKNIGQRFTFGGQAGKDQRVYYFNTKEIIGNKYGTPTPIPFRVVDNNIGLDIDISIRCHGEYSYKLSDPMLFYTNVCGNVSEPYTRTRIDSQLKAELMNALQPAFGQISAMGIRYSALPGHTREIAKALNEVLSSDWSELRGIEVASFAVASVSASPEDENMIKELQKNAVFRNPTMAAAHLVGAQAEAMQSAAANEGQGSFMAFAGMNMAQNAGGMNAQNLFNMGAQQQPQQQPQQQQHAPAQTAAQGGWSCGCGNTGNNGKFCDECGKPKPQPAAQGGWSCSCGNADNTGKFCDECGAKKPEDGWACGCGVVNKGKFCAECGAKKPEGAPLYQCDKCGWEPENPSNPPKFCPECGDIFDDNDKK